MPVLDLDSPGTLWVASENEETNTLHIVLPNAKYTAAALTQNPTVDPRDQLMSPWSASWKDAAANGVAALDLGKSGKLKEIQNKLDALYQAGQDPPKTVKAIAIVNARAGNRLPPRQIAEVIELELIHAHEMRMTGKRRAGPDPLYVTAAGWKAGTRDFLVEITTKGIREVELSTSSGRANIWTDGGPRGARIKVPARDGQPITVHVDVLFTVKRESRQVYHPQITYAWDYWKPAWWDTQSREVFTGEEFTLSASGLGGGEPVKKSIKLRAEAWGSMSDWMGSGSSGPPNVYCHPHT